MTATQQITSDWQAIDVESLFSFRLPPSWLNRASSNFAEVRGEWAYGATTLVYQWGKTESGRYGERQKPWMSDYQETTTRLSGRRANVRSFSFVKDGKRTYRSELNVGNWEQGEVRLFMRVDGCDASSIELAKEIFKTVTLPLPTPERPK